MSDHVALSIDQLGECTEAAAEEAVETSPLLKGEELSHTGTGREATGISETACMNGSEVSCSREAGVGGMPCITEMGRADMSTRRLDMPRDREIQEPEMEIVNINRAEVETQMFFRKVDMGVESEVDCSSANQGLHNSLDAIDEEAVPLLKGGDADGQNGNQVVVAIESGADCSKKAMDSPAFAECRICQEEDDIANLESPCACSGSLKFAHRKCVQHWCNEKGDTLCEICQKPFESGYAIPLQARADSISVDIGAGWDIASGQPRLFALAADHHFLEGDYDDYAGSHAHSAACFRSVALILVALLLLRHIISMTGVGDDEDISTFFMLSLVRAAGFLIPCYIMARAMNALQIRRQRQEAAMAAAAEVTHLLQVGRLHGVVAAEPAAAVINSH
eukprot:c23043_g1_i1 orf=438-1616(-)